MKAIAPLPSAPSCTHTSLNFLIYRPWKKLQLGYLRGIQAGDLRMRKVFSGSRTKTEMFVARRVIPMDSPEVAQTTPLIIDFAMIQNLKIDKNTDYVRGEILGFCEVAERGYGLGDNDEPRGKTAIKKSQKPRTVRPILTNLSVKTEARKSGVGGKLMEACEKAVADWGGDEMILEVESDNERALEFYKKRGYGEVFTDPACRRFNTNGFFLTKERCAKICMRKVFEDSSQQNPANSAVNDLSKMFQSFRETVFN